MRTRALVLGVASAALLALGGRLPDELPLESSEQFADAVIWKSLLEPRMLDEIWRRRR